MFVQQLENSFLRAQVKDAKINVIESGKPPRTYPAIEGYLYDLELKTIKPKDGQSWSEFKIWEMTLVGKQHEVCKFSLPYVSFSQAVLVSLANLDSFKRLLRFTPYVKKGDDGKERTAIWVTADGQKIEWEKLTMSREAKQIPEAIKIDEVPNPAVPGQMMKLEKPIWNDQARRKFFYDLSIELNARMKADNGELPVMQAESSTPTVEEAPVHEAIYQPHIPATKTNTLPEEEMNDLPF